MNAVLGIDTSCYTTSVALAADGQILASERKLLTVPLGQRGLRQSEAVFQHIRQLPVLMKALFSNFKGDLAGVCVSSVPSDGSDSYMPVFQAGLSLAGSLSYASGIPLMTTTHQRGHIRAALYQSGLLSPVPLLCVHLSGGTTDVLFLKDGIVTRIGTSLDLHAGQLVDRVAVKMGLPFPGGPHLEALCRNTVPASVIPVSVTGADCHFSGAENRLFRLIESGCSREAVAAEVYSVLVRTVLRMVTCASERTGAREVLLMGGIASSDLFRKMLRKRNETRRIGLELFFGKQEYSGDNACGVALIGDERMNGDLWQL